MSGDPRRRALRAEADVRAAHRTARGLLDRASADDATWRTARGGGRSPAETLLHLALVGAAVSEGLRAAGSGAAVRRERRRTLAQSVLLKALLATWRHPAGDARLPGTDPGGTLETPEVLRERHVAWAADLVRFLRAHDDAYLARVWFSHPRFGDLDPFEWTRWLRIYLRHHELRFKAG